jgi:HD-GYP domain-containing protein (c-di-GMP phosphodiesterase class II)
MQKAETYFTHLLKELTDIGTALSSEKNHARLLELILMKAKELTHSDGGTLYINKEDKHLHFEIVSTESLNIHFGGSTGQPIPFEPLPLYNEMGGPNLHMVSTWAVHNNKAIKIDDAYEVEQFDFSGTIAFDKLTGYRSQSFLTVPMTNHLNEVIGVLQLINARDRKANQVIKFSALDQQVVESLASQAAVIMTNRSLINAQKALFDALIKLIADSIDEKSPYTAGHCRRVPVITRLLADAVCNITKGPLKDFKMTDEEKYELDVAAWLHDCGKITTPVQVVDKATKLEAIVDRINWVDTRFEILRRDAMLQALYRQGLDPTKLSDDQELQDMLNALKEERAYLHLCNQGAEQISADEIARIEEISNRHWHTFAGEQAHLLNEEEVDNLKIGRGTLSKSDRDIINHHVSVTIKLLESLPYPKGLQRVPLIAGCHHEKVNGTGYPRGLTRDEMPIEARILAIADVFEALTASDRPYKKAIPLSQALRILGQMKLEGHIDPDLFDVFMHSKSYLAYAKNYLDKELIDEFDLNTIPGYQPYD